MEEGGGGLCAASFTGLQHAVHALRVVSAQHELCLRVKEMEQMALGVCRVCEGFTGGLISEELAQCVQFIVIVNLNMPLKAVTAFHRKKKYETSQRGMELNE